jgi:methylenetetrahydrofolate reductase (NADPH)
MPPPNPVREALTEGRFCYMVELVASQLTREAKLMQAASQLAQVPGLVAGSVTSYAGGAMGHDPIRVAAAARARGLFPNVHLTCVNKDRLDIRHFLEDVHALGIENVFAITGDYPQGVDRKAAAPYPAPFDLDSVQLIEFINELRQQGMQFYISAAVSPFKYTEADCAYQYLKLEKKIRAGADYAVTQLGYDVKKYRELKRYLDERGLKTPVFGNVYILTQKGAERMSKGTPPGCWVAPELVSAITEETKASKDKGLGARLERAARMVAVLRGLGYAGAYIGGDHQADRVNWIIKRSEELAPKWEEIEEEIQFAPKGGFYFFESQKAPAKPISAKVKFFEATTPTGIGNGAVRGIMRSVFAAIDKSPAAAKLLERTEVAFKNRQFGCHSCGNCVLADMEYVCPMTCPKNLRNGPCGGTLNGQCEVVDQQCIWVEVYDRAKAENRIADLNTFIPARHRNLQDTSSWINFFLERDSRPERPPHLVQITAVPPVKKPVEQLAKANGAK